MYWTPTMIQDFLTLLDTIIKYGVTGILVIGYIPIIWFAHRLLDENKELHNKIETAYKEISEYKESVIDRMTKLSEDNFKDRAALTAAFTEVKSILTIILSKLGG